MTKAVMTNAMPKEEFETAMQDVAKAFGSPAELLADERLSRAQKLKLLQQWDYDLGLLLVAGEENMAGDGSQSAAERLRLVRDCIERLGGAADAEKNPTGKVGGAQIINLDRKPRGAS